MCHLINAIRYNNAQVDDDNDDDNGDYDNDNNDDNDHDDHDDDACAWLTPCFISLSMLSDMIKCRCT